MKLSHFDSEPFILDRSRTYEQRSGPTPFAKPKGLWVSVDGEDDWEQWCRSEQFDIESLTARHGVVLKPDANVHLIRDIAEFDDFERRFSVPTPYGDAIDWETIAAEFYGIIIAPYFWQRRFHDWYYGWDCASGCLWNLSAIAEFTIPAVTA